MAKKPTIKTLPIATFLPIDMTKNVRDPSGETYKVEGLKNEIFTHGGLKTRPLVHFKGDAFDRIIQGFRRITSISQLHEEFPNDRRWDDVEVEIVQNLTDAEVMFLAVDSGNTKSLERHEVVRAVWMVLDAEPKITRDDLVTMVYGLLQIHWPTTKTDPKEVAKHYTGTIQNITGGWRLPKIGSDYFMQSVKEGKAVSYRKKDYAALVKVFEDECKQNLTLTKAEPGPVFLAKWEEFIASEEQAAKDGKKPKAIAMMNKSEVEAIIANTNSVILKGVLSLVIRSKPESDKKLALFGNWLARDFPLNEEQKKMFLDIMEGTVTQL